LAATGKHSPVVALQEIESRHAHELQDMLTRLHINARQAHELKELFSRHEEEFAAHRRGQNDNNNNNTDDSSDDEEDFVEPVELPNHRREREEPDNNDEGLFAEFRRRRVA